MAAPYCSYRTRVVCKALFGLVMVPLLLNASAGSQETELDPAAWPLSSVGRVNVITGAGSRTQCTGTLIGPRHALTAAHCLFNKARGVWVHPSSVHFVAGYERGEYRAHSLTASYENGEGFVPTDIPQPASISQDWALIELAEPMDIKPIKIQTGSEAIREQTDIVRAGYRGDRAHVLTVQGGCSAKAVSDPAPLLLHSCGAVHGESGSALLSFNGNEPQIVGIVVAGSKQESTAPSLAVPSTTFASAVDKALSTTF